MTGRELAGSVARSSRGGGAGAGSGGAGRSPGGGGRGGGVRPAPGPHRRATPGTVAPRLHAGAAGGPSPVPGAGGPLTPSRRNENGRGLVFMYVDAPYPAGS